MDDYRIPPQNLDIETSILSTILLHNDPVAYDILTVEDFYRSAHGKIFNACKLLADKQEPVDLVSVVNKLKELNQLQEVGGAHYIAQLTGEPISPKIEYHAAKLRELATLRKIIELSYITAQKCFDNTGNFESILNDFQVSAAKIETGNSTDRPVTMAKLSELAVDRYEAIQDSGGIGPGLKTGFVDLDRLTCGLQDGDFILLAARPSMGKTALALNIAENIADIDGGKIAIFSLEMAKSQLYDRIMASNSRINSMRFKSGRFSQDDWMRITDAASRIAEWQVWIDDTPSLHYTEIRRRARWLKANKGIDIVIVDYLQLVQGDIHTHRKIDEIDSISHGMKALAKELSVPVLVLSQLSRKVEERPKKRPILSDLRESGTLEQDADVVLFIYRDDYYNPDEGNPNKGKADIIIAKNRNGPTCDFRLAWLEQITRFENYSGYEGGY